MNDAMTPVRAFVGLGSNIGDREANLSEALRRLSETPGAALAGVSAVYETEAVGLTDQPPFLNLVAALSVTCDAAELLARCLEVEAQMGRVRVVRWGPRNIDIDLLLFGEARVDTPELTVPHPRLLERQFVLVPLADVAPDLVLPDGQRASEAADPSAAGIRRWGRLRDMRL